MSWRGSTPEDDVQCDERGSGSRDWRIASIASSAAGFPVSSEPEIRSARQRGLMQKLLQLGRAARRRLKRSTVDVEKHRMANADIWPCGDLVRVESQERLEAIVWRAEVDWCRHES